MRVCILHERMASELAGLLRLQFPDDVFLFSDDIRNDPPGARDSEVLIAHRFPKGLLGRMESLRWLQLTSAGHDHVLEGEPRVGLLVTDAGPVSTVAVAEYVWSAAFCLSKGIPRILANQAQKRWEPFAPRLLAGTTALIVGLGSIGREVAAIGSRLGVRILAVTRRPRRHPGIETVVGLSEMATLAPRANFLIIAIAASDQTLGLVSAPVIEQLPVGAVVINVARASILDPTALIRGLEESRLSGALLDVFDEEPLVATNPLWHAPNLILSPHMAYQFPGRVKAVAALIARNLRALKLGRDLENLVNLGEGRSSANSG
ncbi:MAG: NAD(P)-dependent oxidoreductase [Deltaproteobacteria bacterium]